MNDIEVNLFDRDGYLLRMAAPLRDKLRVAAYMPNTAGNILDVGCADGSVTLALGEMFPQANMLGIDLNEEFVARAQAQAAIGLHQSVEFRSSYLRDLLVRDEKFVKYDVILFTSVLHEFYSYGEGMSSVMKALADAYELLRPGGVIIIRDMILKEHTKVERAPPKIIEKICLKPNMGRLIFDFERYHGRVSSIYQLNHFLLKYMYDDNWGRECPEHYVPVTLEQYKAMAKLLGLQVTHEESYALPYLYNKWRQDFGLTKKEVRPLRSTTLLALTRK